MDFAANIRNQPCPVDPTWLGRATISPAGSFPVGATGTWTISYQVGRYGLDDSGAIIVVRRIDDGSCPQTDDPAAPGYVTATTDGRAILEVGCRDHFWVRPWRGSIIVTVRDGSLAEGDTITVTLGDTSGGSSGWRLQSFPEVRHRFGVLVDAFGTGEFYWLREPPAVEIVPDAPANIEVVLPSLVEVGQPVCGHVRVRDRHGNPVRQRVGEATLRCEGEVDGLPLTVAVDDGVVAFTALSFKSPGTYWLTVTCGDLVGRSNPLHVLGQGERPARLYWGDMHGQTEETVGTGTVEQYFHFARHRALMDVGSWQGNDFQITDALWQEVQKQTAAINEPGRFVSFLGYEWSGLTPAGGDHNIYFLGDQAQIHRSSHWQVHDGSDPATDRYPLGELFRKFEGRDDVLIVSHVGGHANFDFASDEFPNLVEIHSHHGTFEWIAEEAMRRGLCVGFVGQSDDHTCRPGLSGPLQTLDPKFVTFDVCGGYTGIYADQLTRRSIWRALKDRHCYATTGRRIVLGLRCGQAMMGDIIERPAGGKVELDLEAIADGGPIVDLEIRRGSQVVYRHRWPEDVDSEWLRLEWSGVRIRSRRKTTTWTGRLVVKGATIEEFRPCGFGREGQGVRRTGDRELAVRSTTSGNLHGLLLRLSDKRARLTFESAQGEFTFNAAEIGPGGQVFPCGGVNQQFRVSRFAPQARGGELRLRWTDAPSEAGRHAYWVKVVQADGHMAWSSPLFVDMSDAGRL
ncbi:MAG: DUF3604 domain-containing protein [Anaerolineaceae bacterium]|nr:DUF3604 domain-containing protein [Anaerolineaceae bacterium]